MSIEIEKGVPMPARTRPPDLPFGDMDIGDSLAPVETGNQKVQALRQRVTRFQKHHPPKKFSVVQDGEAMRVFRVI